MNLETMTLEPAEAGQRQEQMAAALVPQLQLSEQQLEVIPVAMRLYYDLLAAIHQVRPLLCLTLSIQCVITSLLYRMQNHFCSEG